VRCRGMRGKSKPFARTVNWRQLVNDHGGAPSTPLAARAPSAIPGQTTAVTLATLVPRMGAGCAGERLGVQIGLPLGEGGALTGAELLSYFNGEGRRWTRVICE